MPRTAMVLFLMLWGPTGCGGTAEVRDGPPGQTRWIDDAALFVTGFGQVSFQARDGNHLIAWTYRSSGFDPATGKIWFVMHGAGRDADRYIRLAAPVAERHDALAIAIQFNRQAYPTGDDYTLGIAESGVPGTGTGGWRPPEDMLYAEIEYVFDLVLASLGGEQMGYYLFGHSAGAQFTHRLLSFLPEPRVLGAVAANAGWYTLPTTEDPAIHTMPYGLVGGPVSPQDLARFFQTPFVVLLSEHDTTTAADDDLVRGTPEAEAQGPHRLARGLHYFAVAEAQAAAVGSAFAWRLEIVRRAGHDAAEVASSAGFLSFVPGAASCTPSAAAAAVGLIITEILADPPDGLGGDANGDGVRDPEQDEFIEIVNRGPDPICLAGWALGDVRSPHRHIFPLGPALAPGQYLLVFGGGVPIGAFQGAQVHRATDVLSLQNAGDVLTLRSAEDAVVRTLSWGDCAGAPCAEDHWPDNLSIARSLTRAPEPGAPWQPHPDAGAARYSPGFHPAASPRRE